ncbi:MAG: VWA domain-containing protein [Pseudomonadota bacterium]
MANGMTARGVRRTRFRRRRGTALALAAALQFAVASPVLAVCNEEAMLVFDASGSMSATNEQGRRIDVARRAAADVLPEITSSRPTGLVTYGGTYAAGCTGVELRMPPMADSASLIMSELLALTPSGQTPLSQATLLAAQTLDDGRRPGTVVVLTDGYENCGFNACALGSKLRREAPNIRVHVIGFYLHSVGERSIACLAQQTGGTYTSTRSYAELKSALQKTLTCQRIAGRLPSKATTGTQLALLQPLDTKSGRN